MRKFLEFHHEAREIEASRGMAVGNVEDFSSHATQNASERRFSDLHGL